MNIDPAIRAEILKFVDSVVPGGGESVWLTGSRVHGTPRPDSDWDVIAFTTDASRDRTILFGSNQIGPLVADGQIELVIVNPCFKDDPIRYLADWRAHGLRLR